MNSVHSFAAINCIDITGRLKPAPSSNQAVSDKVVKTYLMANLVYPQTSVGITYAMSGLFFSGQVSYQDIENNLYKAQPDQLTPLYTAMQNTHLAHGVTTDVPFSKVVNLARSVEEHIGRVILSTFFVMFPDHNPTGESLSDVIKEFESMYNNLSYEQKSRFQNYGKTILEALRSKEASKIYRAGFAHQDRSYTEESIAISNIEDFLQAHVKKTLEEAFPETLVQVGPMYDGLTRPLSEAFGRIFRPFTPQT